METNEGTHCPAHDLDLAKIKVRPNGSIDAWFGPIRVSFSADLTHLAGMFVSDRQFAQLAEAIR